MPKTAGKLAPEAKPRVINLLFRTFFVYSRVAYTIFPHTFSEKWHLRQDCREGMCHFRLEHVSYNFRISNILTFPKYFDRRLSYAGHSLKICSRVSKEFVLQTRHSWLILIRNVSFLILNRNIPNSCRST